MQFDYFEERNRLVDHEHLRDSKIPNILLKRKLLPRYKQRENDQVLVSKQQMQALSLLH